ncbi:MAG: hypothetical protein J4G18_17080 [Anaerolineae bacterium]|nr:hypothetical protein [Anaerolineae bacterium]
MKDYEYFLEIQSELAREHDGKLVAIKDKQVLGIFDDYMQAADAVYVEHEYGTVLMQSISKDPDANAIYLHTPGIVPLK